MEQVITGVAMVVEAAAVRLPLVETGHLQQVVQEVPEHLPHILVRQLLMQEGVVVVQVLVQEMVVLGVVVLGQMVRQPLRQARQIPEAEAAAVVGLLARHLVGEVRLEVLASSLFVMLIPIQMLQLLRGHLPSRTQVVTRFISGRIMVQLLSKELR